MPTFSLATVPLIEFGIPMTQLLLKEMPILVHGGMNSLMWGQVMVKDLACSQ